jgi:hypothetical protein
VAPESLGAFASFSSPVAAKDRGRTPTACAPSAARDAVKRVSYFILEDFRLGQDSRKSPTTAAPGTLTTLVNGHITRGGDLEVRKSLVSTYELPTGTFGLGAVGGALYVFGSAPDPGVPSGITYQQLEHPSGSAMTQVLDVNIFRQQALRRRQVRRRQHSAFLRRHADRRFHGR